MYRAGDEFLSGPGLPVNEHRRIRGGHRFDLVQDAAYRLTLEDDLPEIQLGADLIFEI